MSLPLSKKNKNKIANKEIKQNKIHDNIKNRILTIYQQIKKGCYRKICYNIYCNNNLICKISNEYFFNI